MRRSLLAGALLTSTGLVVALAARFGSVPMTNGDFFSALSGGGPEGYRDILFDLRLPRVALGLLVGGGLAMAGGVFQALLRNPLAEPFILGISGGAATGAVLAIALGAAAMGSLFLPAAAFGGALVAIVLVFGVAAATDRRMDVRVLLLAGVVVGAFFSAVIAFIISVSQAQAVRSAILWMMGSLGGADWRIVAVVAAYTIPAVLVLMTLARPLNLMAIGEETAAYLGTEVERVKRTAYLVASLMTAAGVAMTGVIGFVGLIVPHGVRLLIGSDQRALLPFSFLAGAGFLVLADLVARVALAPMEVPIGVITAFVGVPLFLVLLRRSGKA